MFETLRFYIVILIILRFGCVRGCGGFRVNGVLDGVFVLFLIVTIRLCASTIVVCWFVRRRVVCCWFVVAGWFVYLLWMELAQTY